MSAEDSQPWRRPRPRKGYLRKAPKLGAHRHSPKQFLERYDKRASRLIERNASARAKKELLKHWCDPRMLWPALQHIARHGGRAPGPDGRQLGGDLKAEKSEWFREFRQLHAGLGDGTYCPDPPRIAQIPKKSGNGYRKLSIANLIDRVIARAAKRAIEPFIEPGFEEDSFAFRPRRSVWGAIIRARSLYLQEDRSVWISHDLKDAFDSVPRSRLFQLLARWTPETMCHVMERLVATDSASGIQQGSPLSPDLLNYYLDTLLDKPIAKQHPNWRLLRYCDDLLLPCCDRNSALETEAELRERVSSCGFRLKATPEAAVVDLQEDKVSWLGYRFRAHRDGLFITMSDTCWDSLRASLWRCEVTGAAEGVLYNIVRNWIKYYGPAYEYEVPSEIVDKLFKKLKEWKTPIAGLCRQEVKEWWRRSWRVWRERLAKAT